MSPPGRRLLKLIGGGFKRSWQRTVWRLSGRDLARLRDTGARIRTDPCTPFGRELLEFGYRPTESFMFPLLQDILYPGDVFLDIGAHWGTYSIPASEWVGTGGRVIAVEPFPASFRLLRANARLNRCSNLTPVNTAVGDRQTCGFLVSAASGDNLATFLERRPTWRGRLLPRFLRRAMGLPVAVTCRMSTLERILADQGVSEVAVMKMDIEGSECLVFQTLPPIARRFRVMLIELHPPFPGFQCDTGLLYRVLATDRDLFTVDGRSGRWSPIADETDFLNRLGEYYFLSIRRESPPVIHRRAERI